MPQSLAQIYVHLIFSTKGRLPLLEAPVRLRLFPFLSGVLAKIDSPAIAIGGIADHVHILFRQSKRIGVADVVKEAKIVSAKWLKTERLAKPGFHWQAGYAALSVSPSRLESVKAYVDSQEKHHQKKSFQDELRELLEKSAVEYDERFLWD